MRRMNWTKSLALTGLALVMTAATMRAGDDERSGRPTVVAPRPVRVERGLIRVIGPDGKVHERHFEGGLPIAGLQEKLQELRDAAGDREAVERISQELLELTRAAGGSSAGVTVEGAAAGGEGPAAMPKFGIGVSLAPEIPAPVRAHLKLGEKDGVLVQSVAKGGPAEKAGIKEFDVLLAVGGEAISAPQGLVDAVQKAGEAQQAVSLAVISAGEHKTIEVTPAASQEIAWDFANVENSDWLNYLSPNGDRRNLTLRMAPGMFAPKFTGPEGQVIDVPHVQLMAPFEGQRKLEERIEKLERKLDELAKKLSQDQQ